MATDTATTGDPVVLVVDDESELAELFATWLAEEWAVRIAHDGEEAIAKTDEAVEVVLLDRRLPDRSGDDVLDAIHERGSDCRVVMVTAVDPDFDIIEMGFDDYLIKPIGSDELRDTVERVHRRSKYDTIMCEYYSLVSKRAVLGTEKSRSELETSEEFQRLERRLDELRESVDETIDDLDGHAEFAAAFRDLGQDCR